MKRALLGIGLALMAMSVQARPPYNQLLRERYKPSSKSELMTNTCAACHVGSTTRRNLYGKDLQKAMAALHVKTVTPAVLARVEKLDSDKDGVPNGVELRAGSLPGDPYVKPAILKHAKTPARRPGKPRE